MEEIINFLKEQVAQTRQRVQSLLFNFAYNIMTFIFEIIVYINPSSIMFSIQIFHSLNYFFLLSLPYCIHVSFFSHTILSTVPLFCKMLLKFLLNNWLKHNNNWLSQMFYWLNHNKNWLMQNQCK